MKDYKLSELKEICNSNYRCDLCPIYQLCKNIGMDAKFYDLEIDEEEGE